MLGDYDLEGSTSFKMAILLCSEDSNFSFYILVNNKKST